ncbi:LysR family transcriptional regulator [Bacillus sp. S/N-304-OC-R1]|uniref:LysR family transcriptional regulator n=1 Tax=Bacillus sp. S/N-304-OC-R1 TaxID=2758034 RepID=UPI001C8EC1DC|nr:LysR family transcriptional regulator [Bacillus sp. S/N-304-OC-R1]MBY0124349.1 LysR family transcriptional regulator [Bacillus sp. S/N-304-OC-R1]
MNISQYEAFLKTIELGSLTKAAQTLGYTQSGITHMLNALESEFRMKLLNRDRSGATVTSDGMQLLPYIQAVLNCQHNLNNKLDEIHRLESGLIRVGTFTSVSAQWLPGMIKNFRLDFPKIQFELLHGTYQENEKWLMDGRLDCAFVRVPANKQLETIYLRRDPLVVVLPENHPRAHDEFFPISGLSKHPYIKLDEGDDDEISEIFTIHQIAPNVQFVEKDDYAVIAMVEKGLGISILPELVLKNISRKVIYKELEIPSYRDLGVAVKDTTMLSTSAQIFLTYVQTWISKEYS